MPPVLPMLAKAVKGIPDPEKYGGLSFEPKWDGFRCLVFKDGDEVELASRNTKPLTRYFPEVVAAAREQLPERCVLDGELFVALPTEGGGEKLEFETLQERIHPAESRITMLAEKTPARVRGVRPARARGHVVPRARRSPSGGRRWRRRWPTSRGPVAGPCHLTRTTTDAAVAEEWFRAFEGAGLDGVIAKPVGATYQPNARTMLKIKHERTADVVVAGYRDHKTSTPDAAAARQPAPGPVRRRRAAAHRRQRQLHRRAPGRAVAGAAAARRAHRGPPVGPLAGVPDRQPRPGAGHAEPLEPGQGPLVHPAAARAGGRGGLRPHGGTAASGTPRSSSAGGPTATPSRAATTSSRRSCPTTSATSSGADLSP